MAALIGSAGSHGIFALLALFLIFKQFQQHGQVVKKLDDNEEWQKTILLSALDTSTKALTVSSETVAHNTEALQEVRDAVAACKAKA